MRIVIKTGLLVAAGILLSFLGSATEPFTLERDGGTLHGTLLIPERTETPAVVLIIAGSGPTDRDGNSRRMGATPNTYKYLAQELHEAGFASLRFDKRLVGESTDGFKMDNGVIEDYMGDVKAIAEVLAADHRFSEVVLAGHSEGSLIALAAATANPDIDKVVCIAGAGRPLDVILMEQLNRDKALPEELNDELMSVIDDIKRGKVVENESLPQTFLSLFHEGVQPFIRSCMSYDPAQMVAGLEIPVMIIQGGTDLQIRVVDAENLKRANPAATLLIIPDMNHVLKQCEAEDMIHQFPYYLDPDIPIHPGIISPLSDFLSE